MRLEKVESDYRGEFFFWKDGGKGKQTRNCDVEGGVGIVRKFKPPRPV